VREDEQEVGKNVGQKGKGIGSFGGSGYRSGGVTGRDRRQTCDSGRFSRQPLWFLSKGQRRDGEVCCEVLLSTIFQLFWTCSADSSPPFFDHE
jgi:hypothetical protein